MEQVVYVALMRDNNNFRSGLPKPPPHLDQKNLEVIITVGDIVVYKRTVSTNICNTVTRSVVGVLVTWGLATLVAT